MTKCRAQTIKGCFATPHVCGLKKGHKGSHCCKKLTDPMFPLSRPVGVEKICNHKWKSKRMLK